MPLQKAEALFNFKPTAPVELELKKGDIVVVRRTSVGEGWWEGEINNKRGLFPSSFVKMLPASAGGSPVKERKPPLTPGTSKKAFMETLLTPSTNLQEQLYDVEKASDIFVQGHSEISITAGPRWDCFPPTLTIFIKDLHTETRFSGVKHFTVFDVETKQLGTQVTRRYKNFLWLYDRMAEIFPCISLPPLPVKQFSGIEEHGVEARRRGLEKFLNRVANHPVLGSTKLLWDFLTEKADKDWKIGRQMSNIKLPKTAKKLFNAPIYCTVKYPPFNVPINQLPSIEKFSRFSRLMENQIHALHTTCGQLCHSSGEMMSTVNSMGKVLQKMAKGKQTTVGIARRRVTPTHTNNLGVPNGHTSFLSLSAQGAPSENEEEGSEGEIDDKFEWNWRDDSKFNCMMSELYQVAGGIRKLAGLHQMHQESVERNVLDALSDYVGVIHTLPMLVRLHEDAMEAYNTSKEKDTKKEAEEIRQHCETLNNIILAEFDYFSNTMVGDFENIILNLLKEQAIFHKQLAKSWDSLYEGYMSRRSSRHPQGTERITSSGKTFSFNKSSSFSGSFPSSHASSDSFDISIPTSPRMPSSVPMVSSAEPSFQSPGFITVEKLDPAKQSDSWERLDESMIVRGPQDDTLVASNESNSENKELYESVIVHRLEAEEASQEDHKSVHDHANYVNIGFDRNLEKDKEAEVPSYANIEIMETANTVVPKPKSAPSSPKKQKKPMPIKRKQDSGESQGSTSLTSSQEMTNSSESNSSPPLKRKAPKKPLPPAKPDRPVEPPTPIKDKSSMSVSTPALNQLLSKSESIDKPLPPVPGSLLERRVRSKTSGEGLFDKKQPLLPPMKLLRETTKTTDNVPALKERELEATDTPPKLKEKETEVADNPPTINEREPPLKAPGTIVHHTDLKSKLNEPTRGRLALSVAAADDSQTGRDELMKKLSKRRQRLEQQLGAHDVTTHKPSMANIAEIASERHSIASTSSSEVVVKYSTREENSNLSSNGGIQNTTDNSEEVALRKHPGDDETLAKFGIIEFTEGGSYVI